MATASKLTGIATLSAAAVVLCWRIQRRRARGCATVTQLCTFPVKSMRGIALEEVHLDAGGFLHDREWMVVRPPDQGSSEFLTIRELPRMATIQPSFTREGKLMLSTDAGTSIVIDDVNGARHRSRVWRTEVFGFDQGDAVAKFLSDFLETPVRLIRMQEAARLLANDAKYTALVADDVDGGGVARFSDWSPLSLISEQSLHWLNSQESVPMAVTNARLRHNIVVDASEPFAEDSWHHFCVGEVPCRFLKMVGRCMVTCTDPISGIRDLTVQPLKTLRRLRSGEYSFLTPGTPGHGKTEAFIGINLRHFRQPGQRIRVGDKVVVDSFERRW